MRVTLATLQHRRWFCCVLLSDTRILKFTLVSEALVEDFDGEILWTLVPDRSAVTKPGYVVRGSSTCSVVSVVSCVVSDKSAERRWSSIVVRHRSWPDDVLLSSATVLSCHRLPSWTGRRLSFDFVVSVFLELFVRLFIVLLSVSFVAVLSL